MGVLHLQQPSSLFNSTYGNILILKLLVVFSMAILGGYHNFRVSILTNQKIEKMTQINQLQNLKRFNKSLKIEYILGIGIIFISSFLTVTSPPQHESHNMNMTPMIPLEQSDLQEMTNTDNQSNYPFDTSFSFIGTFIININCNTSYFICKTKLDKFKTI